MAEAKHGFRTSTYERRPSEQYFTHPWCTRALMKHAPLERLRARPVWEPAAGRGDITEVLQDEGIDVANSDIDVSNFNTDLGHITASNFLDTVPDMNIMEEYSGIITNPPYGGKKVIYDGKKLTAAEAFVRHALELGVDYVAMILRTDWNHSSKRVKLFNGPPFAYEVVLTSRPRWDWWYDKDPWEESKSPMHNFSWFVWDRLWTGPSTQFWVSPKDVGGNEIEDDGDEDADDIRE